MSTEKLVEEMRNGNILTTIGHGNLGGVYSIANREFKQIGIVTSQEASDDMELSDFRTINA